MYIVCDMSVTEIVPPPLAPIAHAPAIRPINKTNPHIVVLGGGFGGLNFAKVMRNVPAQITLIDRQNHHLFQPLLYQVATAALSSVEVSQPLRSIFRDYENVSVEMGDAQSIDLKERTVTLPDRTLTYDYLVIALGGGPIY